MSPLKSMMPFAGSLLLFITPNMFFVQIISTSVHHEIKHVNLKPNPFCQKKHANKFIKRSVYTIKRTCMCNEKNMQLGA